MTTFTKEYTASATSARHGEAQVTLTLNFDNESNTSVITFGDGFIVGGQTTGYTGAGIAQANSNAEGNSIKLYSLRALTKLGTNLITLYKSGECDFNKQTRYICDLTSLALSIKRDIYSWRKSLKNDEQ